MQILLGLNRLISTAIQKTLESFFAIFNRNYSPPRDDSTSSRKIVVYHSTAEDMDINGYESCKTILCSTTASSSDREAAWSDLTILHRENIRHDTGDTLSLFYAYDEILSQKSSTSEKEREVAKLLLDKNRYSLSVIDKSPRVRPFHSCQILLTMTTCRRLSLFQTTIGSILNHWGDLHRIDLWFCVDDNSSDSDRRTMAQDYPWIDYYWKTRTERGHCTSMNIIHAKLVQLQPQYWIHIEDDFLFYKKRNYVADGIRGLQEMHGLGVRQVLFNRNYGETIDDYQIQSGKPFSNDFVLHDYQPTRKPGTPNCCHWPHFSLRPSVMEVKAILQTGNFEALNTTFFERDYAVRYCRAGFTSAFFNTMTCLHIGRLLRDKDNTNIDKSAYELNRLPLQQENSIIFRVIRTLHPKRGKVKRRLEQAGITKIILEPVIDEFFLQPTIRIIRLFRENNFGSSRAIIRRALSHYKLWNQLLTHTQEEYFMIIEDHTTPHPSFQDHFSHVQEKDLAEKDVIVWGYHGNLDSTFSLCPLNKHHDGDIDGAFSYSISRRGAQKMVDYIRIHGIHQEIDKLLMANDKMDLWKCRPPLFFPGLEIGNKNPYDSMNLEMSFNFGDFHFHPCLDMTTSHNLERNEDLTIHQLVDKARRDPSCVGVNTLGYMKATMTPLTTSPYFSGKDGIYIKKSVSLRER